MAIVIPDSMEEEFKRQIQDAMEVEHWERNSSDWIECQFCHQSGYWTTNWWTTQIAGYEPIEHTKDCLGVRLLALESVEAVEEPEPEPTMECPDCIDGLVCGGFKCYTCGGHGEIAKR